MTKKIKQLGRALRRDPKALFELRQLTFAMVIVFALIYVFNVFYLEPRQKSNRAKTSQLNQLVSSGAGGELNVLLEGQKKKLDTTKKKLEEKISRLKFKEKILQQQYSVARETETFTKTAFTLLPNSPIRMENRLHEMNVLKRESFKFFNIDPINIKGKMKFAELIQYLDYLEQRPEIGMIGPLVLEMVAAEPFAVNEQVQFNLILGKVELNRN